MNRRRFLSAIGAAIAGAAFDPERALWTPGAKLISIPARRSLFDKALIEDGMRLLQRDLKFHQHAFVLSYARIEPRLLVAKPHLTFSS